ncbi:MAG: Holliday junction branch migration protein RuvA [Alphaproteobacteria bacterium]|nr:Holliday junction branch migration protein RuvA [Alphaproteobacteria bacterium]
MIAKLRGSVDSYGDDYAIIDVNGVGYLVYASAKTLAKLIKGSEVSLLIETVVREDSITLFGFADAWEKEWFNTLTKVQGVGAKVCLAILSVLTPIQLAQAISAQDKTSFTRASGVGPKLAARIVTELKDKIVTIPTADVVKDLDANMNYQADVNSVADVIVAQESDPNKIEDAISALVNLGYQRLEAYKVVNRVMLNNHDADMATLIKLALKEFASKDKVND